MDERLLDIDDRLLALAVDRPVSPCGDLPRSTEPHIGDDGSFDNVDLYIHEHVMTTGSQGDLGVLEDFDMSPDFEFGEVDFDADADAEERPDDQPVDGAVDFETPTRHRSLAYHFLKHRARIKYVQPADAYPSLPWLTRDVISTEGSSRDVEWLYFPPEICDHPAPIPRGTPRSAERMQLRTPLRGEEAATKAAQASAYLRWHDEQRWIAWELGVSTGEYLAAFAEAL